MRAPSADDLRRRADAVRGDAGQSAYRTGRRIGPAAPLHLRRRGAARRHRPALVATWWASTSSTASARPRCCTSSSPTAPDDIRYGTSGKPVPGYEAMILDEHGGRVPNGEAGELVVRGRQRRRGLLEPARQVAAHLPRRVDPHRRHLHPRRRRLLPLLRPHRRHAEGQRHLGLAVRGRGGAGLAPRGAGGGGGRRAGSRRADQAQGLRRAAGGGAAAGCRDGEGTAEDAREGADRRVEIPALDRVRRRPAEDRDRQDPAFPAAR